MDTLKSKDNTIIIILLLRARGVARVRHMQKCRTSKGSAHCPPKFHKLTLCAAPSQGISGEWSHPKDWAGYAFAKGLNLLSPPDYSTDHNSQLEMFTSLTAINQ